MDNNNTSTSFDLPQEFIDTFRRSMADGDTVELPFDAPCLWWYNGKPAYKQLGGSPFFGGWAATADNVDATGKALPAAWRRVTVTNNEGKDLEIYEARGVSVAIISKRKRWIIDQQSGHGRGHTQYLAYLGEYNRDTKAMLPWGPVVLSGKGMSAMRIESALKDFERRTATARRQHANNLPAWVFYAMIGTFGKESVREMVGKGNQSPITPCTVWLPDEITPDALSKWFVGATVAAEMKDYLNQAQDWLAAWKREDERQAPVPSEDYSLPPVDETDFPA